MRSQVQSTLWWLLYYNPISPVLFHRVTKVRTKSAWPLLLCNSRLVAWGSGHHAQLGRSIGSTMLTEASQLLLTSTQQYRLAALFSGDSNPWKVEVYRMAAKSELSCDGPSFMWNPSRPCPASSTRTQHRRSVLDTSHAVVIQHGSFPSSVVMATFVASGPTSFLVYVYFAGKLEVEFH